MCFVSFFFFWTWVSLTSVLIPIRRKREREENVEQGRDKQVMGREKGKKITISMIGYYAWVQTKTMCKIFMAGNINFHAFDI